MKQLNLLLANVRAIEIHNNHNAEVVSLTYDSRSVERGALFFAVRGTQSDGHNYIASAIERGATAIVCEQLPQQLNDAVCYVVVEDSNIAMAHIASTF